MIGLVLEYEDRVASIPLLQVLRLPLIGTQYKLTEKDGVEENLNAAIDSLININADIGYLSDFGSLQISSVPPGMPGMPQDQSTLNNFQQLVAVPDTLAEPDPDPVDQAGMRQRQADDLIGVRIQHAICGQFIGDFRRGHRRGKDLNGG